MKYFFVIGLTLIMKLAYSQTICFDVDSVLVYYVPWDIHPKFSLNENDIKIIDSSKKVFRDSVIVNELLKTQFKNEVFKKEDDFSIDVRMLIEIYFQNQYITISINDLGCYVFDKTLYMRNIELVEWINNYITEMD